MKICTRCGVERDASNYYPSQSRTWCKSCMNEYTRDLKRNNPNRARKWRKTSARKYYDKHKKHILEQHREYNHRNPRQAWAHNKISKALRYGKMIRPEKCEKCHATEYIQAAHPNHNYNEPFKVKWLCVKCHREMDGTKLEYRKTINA